MGRFTVYNNIFSDEKWKDVCQENKDLLDEFIEYLESTDKSQTTIKGYLGDIKICYIWSLEYNKNKFFIDFTKRDIMKYQNYLLNTLNLGSNRIRRLKASISSMSNFIESMMDDEYPNFRNIINKIPAPSKQAVREKTVLEDEQVEYILNYLVEKKKYQQACAFALASASGSRKSEILRFKVSYFTDENIIFGSLYKTPEKMKTKGRGSKGKLIFRYVLVSKFKPYFDLWMKQREELGITCDELFVTKHNNEWIPMQITNLDSYTRQFSKILNVDFYFHSLRHFFTTALSKSNVPDSVIKSIVGWESLEMVNLYKDIEVDEELGKYFDENGVKQIEQKTLSDL